MKNQIKDNWETPQHFYDLWGAKYKCNLDVAASSENTKCVDYFDIERNGLLCDWDGRVWCNPPYSNLKAWTARAYRQRNNCEIIICLLPAKTDTQWFHSFVYRKAALFFIKGRIAFELNHTVGGCGRTPFPSMIAIYRPDSCSNAIQERLPL